MSKKIVLFWLLALVIVACGEEGVETDIEKTTVVAFEISKDEVNATPNGTYQLKKEIDFAQEEFKAYINDTKDFKIERLQIEISGFDEAVAASLIKQLEVEVAAEGLIYEFITANDLRIENTGKVLLFEINNPFSLLSEEQILTLESISEYVLAQRPLAFDLEADFEGPLNSDFTITFYFDMVARVALD